MTGRVEERPVTSERVSGGISHLLRTARSECQSAVSFVALSSGDEHFCATYPAAPAETGVAPDAVADLVRRLRADPGIAQGKALLRTVRVAGGRPGEQPSRLAVAAVPFSTDGAGDTWGLLGVADPDVKAFGFAELKSLSPVARRLASYLAARRELRRQATRTDQPRPEPAAPLARREPPSEPRPAHPIADPSRSTGPLASRGGGVTARTPLADPPEETPPAGSPGGGGAVDGVLSPAALLDRTRRLLGGGARAGSLVVVALDVVGATGPANDVAAAAARAIRADLRFDDPVARLGETRFVAVVPLAPGGTGAQAVADRLSASVGAALDGAGVVVRSAQVRADLAAPADAVDLVREVTGKLLRIEPGAPHAR
jgi:hypothetical protein